MLLFSAFDILTPAPLTGHYLLTLLGFGIRMQCLVLTLTIINSLLLMFLVIKMTTFCSDILGKAKNTQRL